MRILIVHNHYGRFAQGGEANVMEAEARLLTEHGHDVMKYERTNAEIYEEGSLADKIRALHEVAWSEKSYLEIKKVIREFKPDIMHVHNYWLVLTPSIFAAAKECGVSTVLTLHNYRLICPGNQLLRNGKVCELCITGNPFRVLYHRCYPGRSLLKSYLSLILYLETKKKAFLADVVDSYIALTNFGRSKFIEAGLPGEKIFVKPNFMRDPMEAMPQVNLYGKGALFAGRLSPEKGIAMLLKAWDGLDYPLWIAGDGPLLAEMKRNAPASAEFIGWQPQEEIIKRLCESTFFVFPSDWYEGFSLSLLEAMALGKAIIASNLGPRREMVDDGVSGLLFEAGNPKDLRAKVELLIQDGDLRRRLGKSAREMYLENYTPEKNYRLLMNIYNQIRS
jgi:glycosyltransferase involved in cell wall biosynthesis